MLSRRNRAAARPPPSTTGDVNGIAEILKELKHIRENMATKAEMDSKFDEMESKFDTKLNSLSENMKDVKRRLDQMNPVFAARDLKPYVLKLFGTKAASGIDGGTWTMLRCDDRCFAVSALHVADCFKVCDGPKKAVMALPQQIAKATTAVGLYDCALTTLDGGSNIPNHVDVLVVEVDIAKLPKKVQANVLDINPAAALHTPDDTPVVGWSEQMPLSGRMKGAKDGVVYIAEGEGCVPGNSGTCVFRVVDGVVDTTRPLGVYMGSATDKLGVVVPLPRKFPKASAKLTPPVTGGAPPVCGQFKMVKAQWGKEASGKKHRVSKVMGREVGDGPQASEVTTIAPQDCVEFAVTAGVLAKFCSCTPADRDRRRGRSATDVVAGRTRLQPGRR